MPTQTRDMLQPQTRDLLNDANSLRASKRRDWVVPSNAIPWAAYGSIESPAFVVPPAVNQAVICSYQVQAGWIGLMTALMLFITGDGGTFIQGSGDGVFTIDVDIPLGNPLATGRFLPGYSNIVRTMGDLANQWAIIGGDNIVNRGWQMHPLETWRAKFASTQNIATGTPCFIHGYIGGVVWPDC